MSTCLPKSPILLLLWKRSDLPVHVISQIRSYKPHRLYISCDGPDLRDKSMIKAVQKARATISNLIDWDCLVRFNFLPSNNGCKTAVSHAIDWFFTFEDFGIILEDDCVPSQSFFDFVDLMRDQFACSRQVACITGVNFQDDISRSSSVYYLSKFSHCWGWATWKYSWRHFDPSIRFWPSFRQSNEWKAVNNNMVDEINYWTKIFNRVYNQEIDSWAYPWLLSCWKNNLLTVTPNKNLVSNIGFRKDSTHTKNSNSKYSKMNASVFSELSDFSASDLNLLQLSPNIDADRYTFLHHYNPRKPLYRQIYSQFRNFFKSNSP